MFRAWSTSVVRFRTDKNGEGLAIMSTKSRASSASRFDAALATDCMLTTQSEYERNLRMASPARAEKDGFEFSAKRISDICADFLRPACAPRQEQQAVRGDSVAELDTAST